MTDIRDWLASLGLEKYAEEFRRAEIDVETLPHLTEADLKELGLPIGPRRKLLAASAVSPPPSDAAALAPERRHLTVMFVDLVGSTNLSVRVDPEILSKLLKTFKDAVSAEVMQMGGTITKLLGDGVLSCFGWPHAQEDAAESAIRCGLGVLERVRLIRAPDGSPLRCRIGVATGLTVVGEAGRGVGDAREDSIAGEALNLAARLLSLAEPDSIAMDERTRRQVARLFDCQDLGAHRLAGFDAPILAWRPVGVAAEQDRFTATRQIKTALIGRAQELGVLHGHWAEACRRQGNAVVIVGEAGLGKSRLCMALRAQVADRPHLSVLWQCSAFHQTNALYPVIDYITRAANIDDTDLPALRLEKLSALLGGAEPALQQALPVFADLLSIPPDAGYAAPALRPEQRKAAVIAELSKWIGGLAEVKPLLLVLEDAIWSDATTLELMTRLIQTVGNSSMLVLITVRPEFASPWIGLPQVRTLSLARLDTRQCEDLVREMDAARELQQTTVLQIVEKCDGNPLFLEEISLAVLETRISDAQHVPDTLQASLMSRLDKLGEAKRTAQICAVLGRRFARPLLSEIAALDPGTLDGNLSLLVTRGIIHPLGRSNDGRYEFKHALLRETAYGSLLLSHRQRLHADCASKLEQHFPDVVQAEPELLAYHFAQAGLAAKATGYFELAGDRAADRFAFSEAIASYREALRNNALTEAGVASDSRSLSLLLKLGPALGIINGAQDPETRETYLQAEKLSTALGDVDNLFKAIWGLWYNANFGRDLAQASALAEKLVGLSRETGSELHVLEALHCRWSSGGFSGRYEAASADAERGFSLYDRAKHHRLGVLFGGHDPGVCACGVRGWAMAAMGRTAAGVASAQAGVTLAEALSHPHSLAHALMNQTTTAVIARNYAALDRCAGRLGEIAERFNFPPHRSLSRFFQAWLENQTGNAGNGLGRMTAEFGRTTAIGPMPMFYAALYADALRKAGQLEEALAVIERNLPSLQQAAGFYMSELYRVRGDSLGALGRLEEARHDLGRSDAIANTQGAQLLKLRTAASLLRLAAASGDSEPARAGLKKAMCRMPSNPDAPDFNEARALLLT